ncbi:NhaP-type Na+/H+ or K+/H+ antiporter [Halogranum amylolyticum]|uniref:NhaP-type Na+/H+ or K+/H+ antiporter n=1 Tax=Halogranum amylolyticum TaxID=660520 RepID=A0A1H8NH41_9EURY|nr:NhaP-type Na+/H+ or K+/H+ antiporter [Halogranum amylolyticum]
MVEPYVVGLAVLGVVVIAAAVLPELLAERVLSPPLFFVAIGAIVFSLPLGLPDPDPLAYGDITEKLAEFVVIASLMGAGLKIDRPFSVRTWSTTWRLLVVTMPLTIGVAAVLGWWAVGFVPATALLLGAVIAPTDPVLASDVQVGPPGEGKEAADEEYDEREHEHEVRFGLTSEAGLNDGLAFPFTYAAILVAGSGFAGTDWVSKWGGMYVGYKIAVGVVMGLFLGYLLAKLLFGFSPVTRLAEAVEGTEALGGTLLIYGVTELVQGYGFIAVFVAALVIRHYERTHDYNQALHDFSEVTERLAMAVVLTLFGGALVTGLLAPLTWELVAVGLALVFVLRPLAGTIGLLGSPIQWDERATIAFFGIRGIGSFYYLAYALNEETFGQSETIWALVGFVVLVSVVVHGIVATPVLERLSRQGDA